MNRKLYRLCLVMVIMAAVLSGILYYRVLKKKKQLHAREVL